MDTISEHPAESPSSTFHQVVEIVDTYDGYGELLKRAEGLDPIATAVVYPTGEASLIGPIEAAKENLIIPILVGPADTIRRVAAQHNIDLADYRIEDVADPHEAAAHGVELVRRGEAEALMKGNIHTDELLSEVVRSSAGLRTGRRLSHGFVMDIPTYSKALIVTDGAINIAPTLMEKRDICQNAIDLAHAIGIEQPKVAILSAVETINDKIPSTVDAAALCKMADRGQITGGVLDGPLALDNAISMEAARTKKIVSEVAGDADILLVPDLESGNILAKQLVFLAQADAAGIVLGARVPIILTSRSDSARTRTASCAVALQLAHARRQGKGSLA